MNRPPRLSFVWTFALTCLIWSLSNVASSGEGEWTRFRGPNGTGIGKADLPLQWTSKDYRWQTKLPDVGHSSPVVWGSRLFATSGSETDGTLSVCCLDADSGKILWISKFPGKTHKKNKLNGYASSTPTVDEKRVYVATANPERYLIIALAQTDGHELWRRDLGPFDAEHGFGSSPTVFEDMVIVANEQNGPSSIVALDRKTGDIRWQAERRTQRAAYSTPCLYQPKDGPAQLIVTSSAHGISSIDPRSGKANWELPLFKQRVVGSPLVAGDLIFATAGSGGQGHQMFAVKPGNPAQNTKPEVAYEVKETLPYVPISVSDGPRVYLFNDQGIVTCLEAATGKLCWRERLTGVKFFGSPVLVGDRIYCLSREGTMLVLSAADKYQLLARFDLGEPTQSTPAVANNKMYLRLSAQLMAVGL